MRRRVGFLVNEGRPFRPWADPVRDLKGHLIYRCTPTRPPRRPVDCIVNLGCSTRPEWMTSAFDPPMLNHTIDVATSTNKHSMFRAFCPESTGGAGDRLASWIPCVPWYDPDNDERPADGTGPWVLRHNLTGSRGIGIEIVDNIPAGYDGLATKLMRRKGLREFGILYGPNGVVYRTTMKRKRSGRTYTREEELIRSHDNGWIFSERMPEGWTVYHDQLLQDLAQRLTNVLPWGRADLLMDTLCPADDAEVYVLEVNSRPAVDDSRTRAGFAQLVDDWIQGGCYETL